MFKKEAFISTKDLALRSLFPVKGKEALKSLPERLSSLFHKTPLTSKSQLKLDDLLKAIVVRAGALLNTPHGCIYLVKSGETDMIMQVGVGVYSSFVGCRQKAHEGLVGKVYQTGQPMAVKDYRTWPERLPDPRLDIFRAMGVAPLKSGSEVVGVISLAYLEEGRTFGDNEILLLNQFAQLATIALDNARLYTSTHQELAESKRLEEILQEDKELLIRIIETDADGVTIEDRHGRITLASVTTEKIYGLPHSMITQRTYNDPAWKVTTVAGEPFPDEDHAFAQVMRTGKPVYGVECAVEHPDGTRVFLSIDAEPLLDTTGAVVGVVSWLTDITRRKLLEKALRGYTAELEQSHNV